MLKPSGSPVTEADHASNRVIVGGLREEFPHDEILSEESKDTRGRLGAERVWIVDPLDGTKEFVAGNGEFSVMVGLVVEGKVAVAAVYRPDRDVLYRAIAGEGAWVERDGSRFGLGCEGGAAGSLRAVGSRSHPDPLLGAMYGALAVQDVMAAGSVGVKCSLIAEGNRDLYIHPVPYLKEWDTCAPELILREAGGDVTDCLGQPLTYNKVDPCQPHGIVACGKGLIGGVLRVIRPLYEAAR